jgi:TetR/AcrR family transcriptional repressor of nem operon
MRKSKADTAETRKRIVEMASKVFLNKGLAATGIADIMAAAGLTQGGFYRHFESREHLLAEANAVATDRLGTRLAEATAGKPPREAIDTIVDLYLSQLRQADSQYLCPLANVGSELSTADAPIRASSVEGHKGLVALLAKQARGLGLAEPHDVADAIVSTMVGAVTLSKLATERDAADYMLANARRTVDLLLAGAAKAPAA